MKVAVIRPRFHALDREFAHWLTEKGFDVTLFVPHSLYSKENTHLYRVVTYRTLPGTLGIDFPMSLDLPVKLLRGDYDLVQAGEDFQWISWMGYVAARMRKWRFMITIDRYRLPKRQPFAFFYGVIDRIISPFLRNYAERIICRSRRAYALMESRTKDHIQQKLVFLPIGVNTERFFVQNEKQKERGNSFTLLTIAKFNENKNYPFLLKVIKRVRDRGINVRLVIVRGLKRPDDVDVISEIHRMGLEDVVTIHEQIPHEMLVKIYNEADVFVLLSKIEPQGAVILEAMACGLPILINDIGGKVDFVHKNGFIVPPGDVEATVDAIIKLQQPKLRNALSKRSLTLVRDFFDYNVLFEKYARVMKGEAIPSFSISDA